MILPLNYTPPQNNHLKKRHIVYVYEYRPQALVPLSVSIMRGGVGDMARPIQIFVGLGGSHQHSHEKKTL